MSVGDWRRRLHVALSLRMLTAGRRVHQIAIDLGYEREQLRDDVPQGDRQVADAIPDRPATLNDEGRAATCARLAGLSKRLAGAINDAAGLDP